MNCKNSKQSECVITQNKSQQNSALSANASVNDMSMCSCGCGFEVGSLNFIRLHVESQEEQAQREALEQYNAEQVANEDHYSSLPEPHEITCGCVECN